jgi:hypothetical protein
LWQVFQPVNREPPLQEKVVDENRLKPTKKPVETDSNIRLTHNTRADCQNLFSLDKLDFFGATQF